MNVEILLESIEQGSFVAQRGDDPQFDLRIIGRKQQILIVSRDEGLPDFAAVLGPNWDILEIGILRIEPARGGGGLLVSGVNAPGFLPDRRGKGVGVSRFELRGGSVIEQALDNFVVWREIDQRLFIGGILSRLGLFRGIDQLEILEKDFAELAR